MYCEGNGKIPSLINKFLHDSLLRQPIIILIILFCSLNILTLLADCPQNIIPYQFTKHFYRCHIRNYWRVLHFSAMIVGSLFILETIQPSVNYSLQKMHSVFTSASVVVFPSKRTLLFFVGWCLFYLGDMFLPIPS